MIFNNPTNLTQVTEVLTAADGFTGGMLGLAIYIIVGFGSLFITNRFGMKQSLIASTFVLMALSFFLKYLNLLSDFFLWLSVIFFIGSLLLGMSKGTTGGGA